MAKLDFPSSPTDGQVYAAPNGVDYTWSSTVNAWTAKVTAPLSLVSNGSISGTPEVGKTLAYSGGEAAGGIPPYTYSWEWRLASDNSVLQTDGLTLTVPTSAVGDTIYIFLTATDSAASTATGSTAVYPVGGNVITYTSFPNLTFGPVSGPNASPSTVSLSSQSLYGEVSGTWNDGFTNLTSTGGLQFSVNGGAYGTGSQSISDGDTISLIWDPTAIAAAADGETLTGILTNGTYENGVTITIDRAPTGLTFADLTSQALNTQVTSDTVTPTGYNVPVPVSFAGSATALTSLGLSVAGGSFAASPQTVNPGQSLQLRGTTGGSSSTTYGVSIAMGSNPSATDTWSVTTASVAATIAEPSITSPANGSTDINPATNSPAGVQLVGSTYTPLNGAGAVQTSSTWEVYKAIPTNPETSAIVSTNNAFVTSNWTSQNASTLTYTGSLQSAAYGGGNWIFSGGGVGAGGYGRSTDGGVNWANQSVSYNPVSVKYDGTQFVAAVTDSSNNKQVYKSADGSSWSPSGTAVTSTANSWTTFAVKDSNTYVGSINAYPGSVTMSPVYTTNGGASWSTSTGISDSSGGAASVYDLSSGAFYLASGTSIYKSTTGASWSAVYNGTGSQSAAGAANGVIVFGEVTAGRPFRVSVNGGTTWTSQTNPLSSTVRDIAGNSSGFVAVTDAGVVASADGLTWVTATLPISGFNGESVSTDGTQFTIGGYTTGPSTRRILTGFLSGTELVLTDTTDLANIQVGDTVVEVGGGADATGTITAITPGTPSITVAPPSTNWTVGATAKDTSRTAIPPAPTTEPPDPTKYTAVTGSPFTVSSAPFTTIDIAQSAFSTSSSYYARVRYATTNATAATSEWSAWSEFGTASEFVTTPGTPLEGGYFGGQIDDGGIIYNLIVAPLDTGASPGLQWKNANTAESNADAVAATNQAYGFPMSQIGFTAGAATYPALHWARSLSIGGYKDWYVPAKNELEVLYYFLKPGTTANNNTSGSNLNAVAPEPVATNYTNLLPPQTSVEIFKSSGTEPFSTTAGNYWSATQASPTTYAFYQNFNSGLQNGFDKNSTNRARAIRRVPANAPVAYGEAFGGGYFAGQYVDGGVTYNLIVAPVASGQYGGATPSNITYKTSASADTNPNSQNTVYGKLATDQFNDADHPMFQWARGLTIATFADWYIPAKNEMAILSANLGPNWTTASAFKAGTGAEAFNTANYYFSASESSSNTSNAWVQDFGNGNQSETSGASKINTFNYARAVRRVPA